MEKLLHDLKNGFLHVIELILSCGRTPEGKRTDEVQNLDLGESNMVVQERGLKVTRARGPTPGKPKPPPAGTAQVLMAYQ